MGSAPSNEEPGAGPRPLTRRWWRSHQGRLETGHRPATVQRPRPPPPCSVLRPHSWAEGQRGRPRLNPCSSRWGARLGRAAFPRGPPRRGEVSVTNLLGLRVPARAVVAARAPGTRPPSGHPRPSKLCVWSRRLRRAPAPNGRHPRTPRTGPPPFSFQLRLQRPRPPRCPARTHFSLSPLGRPDLTPAARRFSWRRRCRG